jgi:hypothetical protein
MIENSQFLIHDTYDVFVLCHHSKSSEITDVKLERREGPDHIMCEIKIVVDDFGVERWVHPDDNDYIYAGVIRAPLAWIVESEMSQVQFEKLMETRKEANRQRYEKQKNYMEKLMEIRRKANCQRDEMRRETKKREKK